MLGSGGHQGLKFGSGEAPSNANSAVVSKY